MGYRHCLHIIEKKKLNKLTSKQIKKMEEQSRYDIWEKLGGQEILELGKYSDEGYELGQNGIKVNGILAEFRSIMYYEGDTEFEFLEPEKLVWIAEKYLERTVKYWEMLLSNEIQEIGLKVTDKPSEKCINYVKDLLTWKKFLLNTDKENKYCIQCSWKYEYEMFNIIHCYKTIDWDKYYLVLTGG